MDLVALRQQILSSNKTASEKAKGFLLRSKGNDLSQNQWRELTAGVPEEAEEEIRILKSAGTHLYLHISCEVQVDCCTVSVVCPSPISRADCPWTAMLPANQNQLRLLHWMIACLYQTRAHHARLSC